MREGKLQRAERGAGERCERRRQAATPRKIPSLFPLPSFCPSSVPPSLVFYIPSEVTTACMSKRRSAPQGGWLRHPLRGYFCLLREGKER